MAFVAVDPHDGEVPIPMDEARAALKKALPQDHPVIAQVQRCFELARGIITDHMEETARTSDRPDFESIVDELVPLLSDWRRGIRDWDEVQPAFERAAKAADWLGV